MTHLLPRGMIPLCFLAWLLGVPLLAQKAKKKGQLMPVKENIEAVKPEKDKIETTPAKPQTWIEKFEPRTGLALTIALPLGDVATALSTGIGGYLYGDFSLNSVSFIGNFNKKNIYTYSGLAAGFIPFGVKNAGSSLSIISIEPYVRVNYRNSSAFEPFVLLGFGAGMVSSTRAATSTLPEKSVSSFDAHLVTALGGMYKASDKFEVFLSAGFEIYFEQVSGNFLTIRTGVFYRI